MARNATVPTVEVPIGPNCALDFGPFADAVAVGEWGADRATETLMVTTEGEGARRVSVEDIGEALRSEVMDGQPIHLSTGDVRDPSTGEFDPVGTIEVPLRPGYYIDVFGLGDRGDYDAGALADNTEWARTVRSEAEDCLRHHGGSIDG